MAERLRIIHCFRAPVGGLFRHVLDLSGEQAARGHDVGYIIDSTVADPLTEGRLAQAAEHLRLGITRLPMGRLPGPRDLATSRAVRDAARNLRADVLHGHGAKGGAYARLAARDLRADGRNVATFYTPHGGSLHYPLASPQGLIYTAIETVPCPLYRRPDLRERLHPPRLRQPRRCRPRGRARRPQRAAAGRFHPAQAQPRCCGLPVHRRASPAQGRRRAVAGAGGRSPQDFPCAPSSSAPGRTRPPSTDLAEDLRIGNLVDFPGALPARTAFPLGRCLVVPSRAESMPYIVLEAAAAGMPMLATDVGGIPEIVNGTDTPLLPAGDVGALAQAMQAFLDAPEAAKARATRLQAAVAERFTVERAAGEVLAFYAERLGR